MPDTDSKAFLGRGWAFPPGADGTGEVQTVDHEEDIRQAILTILQTAPGERVMRPDFGVNLRGLVFEPVSTTTLTLVRFRVEQALVRWEPRIDVAEVNVTFDPPKGGRLEVTVRYRVRTTNTFYNLVYPFYLDEGRTP
jgi:phage baseplate assembly protein W